MRPLLRPGTHVLRRGAGELQVGLDPRAALVAARLRRRSATPAAARPLRPTSRRTGPPRSTCSPRTTCSLDERALIPLLGRDGAGRRRRRGRRARPDRPAPPAPGRASRPATGGAPDVARFGHPAGAGSARATWSRCSARPGCAAHRRPAGRPTAACCVGVGEPDRELARRAGPRDGDAAPRRTADRGPRGRRARSWCPGGPRACAASTPTTPTPTRPGRCWSSSTPPPRSRDRRRRRARAGRPAARRAGRRPGRPATSRRTSTGGRPSTWSTHAHARTRDLADARDPGLAAPPASAAAPGTDRSRTVGLTDRRSATRRTQWGA